jgi:hypothetical protein
MIRSSCTIFFLLGAACGSAAQATDSSEQQPLPAKQAPAQPAPQTLPGDSKTKKTKKVWTNEDLDRAHAGGPAAGEATNSEKSKTTAGKTADAGYVANLRKQLEKLQGQLMDADTQIAKLKDFNSGEPVGTNQRKLHQGYNLEPISLQIQTLETKRTAIAAKIDALLDEARKNGIEPGQLR